MRKLIYFLLVFVSTFLGAWTMFDILRSNGMTVLEGFLLLLFTITFAWITMAFWSATLGFILQFFRIDPLSLQRQKNKATADRPIKTRTAILFPIYNEDTRRVFAGVETCLKSLAEKTSLEHFDIYILSDTRDLELAANELGAYELLCERTGSLREHIFYRRRTENSERKVGNIKDFCQRWGALYDFMIILDADSIMTGDCMLSLVHAMQDNPRAGLIQTVPIPVRQTTFFGRFLQFAATLYSPMLASGFAFWQTDKANYWGHNAIIRIKDFINHCGLPPIPAKGPFGGSILSHDFVEAALLHRARSQVILRAELEGSYEEVPSNIIDYAIRDRRWVQGNIQHIGLLPRHGLYLLSRLHFLMGALAYLTSLLWLIMLFLSTVDAIARALHSNMFFENSHQLFPDWPVAKIGLIFSLLYITAGLLFLPKLFGVIIGLIHKGADFGGRIQLLKGALAETLFAILIAPIMMIYHSIFVTFVLAGQQVKWNAQPREGRMIAWSEAFRKTLWISLLAAAWGGLTYSLSPVFFWWLTPILAGLVLAAPIVRYTSSIKLGEMARHRGIFLTPEEVKPIPVLELLSDIMDELPEKFPDNKTIPETPPERWTEMPLQNFQLLVRKKRLKLFGKRTKKGNAFSKVKRQGKSSHVNQPPPPSQPDK